MFSFHTTDDAERTWISFLSYSLLREKSLQTEKIQKYEQLFEDKNKWL